MSPSIQNDSRRNAAPKRCTVAGCPGIMTLQRGGEAVGSAHGAASGGTWVCDSDPGHVDEASPGE
jgi:hypothetical protein